MTITRGFAGKGGMLRRSPARRVALVLVLLTGFWLVAWFAARMLIVSAPLERADIVVVLSGSSTFVERTHLASELYATGKFQRIVLTNDNRQGGWSQTLQRNPYFHERAQWELERLGVPSSAIETIMTPVSSTYDEAVALKSFAAAHGFHSILLVTSAYHSRRALKTFQQLLSGTDIICGVSSPPPGWQTPRSATWLFSIQGWRVVPAEYLKIIYYRWRRVL